MLAQRGHQVEVRVVQQYDTVPHTPTKQEQRDAERSPWMRIPSHDRVPTERLSLSLPEFDIYWPHTFGDTRFRLDEQLGDVLGEAEMRIVLAERRREEQERADQERRRRCAEASTPPSSQPLASNIGRGSSPSRWIGGSGCGSSTPISTRCAGASQGSRTTGPLQAGRGWTGADPSRPRRPAATATCRYRPPQALHRRPAQTAHEWLVAPRPGLLVTGRGAAGHFAQIDAVLAAGDPASTASDAGRRQTQQEVEPSGPTERKHLPNARSSGCRAGRSCIPRHRPKDEASNDAIDS